MKPYQQPYRPPLNLAALPQPEPFKKKRVPGKLRTSTELSTSKSSLDDLLNLSSSRKLTNTDIYDQMQQIIQSLLSKNQSLLAQNATLSSQNTQLLSTIHELQYKISCLLNLQKQTTYTSEQSIMEYLNWVNDTPIITSQFGIIPQISTDICLCREDNNSNIRAFYLSMLQTSATRQLLLHLISDFQNDESWKLVPLLSTNETWVHLTENFLRVLDSNDFIDVDQVYAFINESQLYDIIFISAIRARVQFLGEGYNSQIETRQLYTALSNIFIRQEIQFSVKQTEQYDKYTFTVNDQEFSIYYVESLNKFGMCFNRVQGVCHKSELMDGLEELEDLDILGEVEDSYNIQTPLSTDRKMKVRGLGGGSLISMSEPSSVMKRKKLGSDRYCEVEQED